jgi:hypothetical protein
MKPAGIILAASLVANFALLAAVVVRPHLAARSSESSASLTSAANEASPASAAPPGRNSDGRADEELLPEAGMWPALSAGEPKDLIARLRKAGFPPHVLRTVALQLLRHQQAGRQRELLARFSNNDYWKASFSRGAWSDPQYSAAQRDLAEELRTKLKEMLGADYYPPDMSQDYLAGLGRRYGPLTPDKVEQLNALERDYGELRMQLAMGAGIGVRLPEDNDALKSIHAEMRADLAALLTPAELEEYDRRTSPTAANLRRRLTDVVLTEEEHRSLYELQRRFDERYAADSLSGTLLPQTPEFAQQRAAAQKELNAAVAALIGPERAAEYERAGDFNYQRLKRVAQHLGLPREAAATALDLQREAEGRASAIHRDRSLSADQQTAQLSVLRDEFGGRLTEVLTSQGVEIYKLNGGVWLDRIGAPTKPPAR